MRALTILSFSLIVFMFASGTCLAGGAYADGLRMYEAGEYSKAEKLLDSAVREETDPDLQHQALARLGLVQVMRGNRRSGLPNLESALESAPNDATVLNVYGMGMLAAKEHVKAQQALEKAYELTGDTQSQGLARLAAEEAAKSAQTGGGIVLASANGSSEYRGKVAPLPKFPPTSPGVPPAVTPKSDVKPDAPHENKDTQGAPSPASTKDAAAKTPPAASTATSAASFYTVQTGSWRSQERAIQAAERMARKGFPAFVSRRGDGASAWYQAMSGRFATPAEAQAHRPDVLARAGVASAIGMKVDTAQIVWRSSITPEDGPLAAVGKVDAEASVGAQGAASDAKVKPAPAPTPKAPANSRQASPQSQSGQPNKDVLEKAKELADKMPPADKVVSTRPESASGAPSTENQKVLSTAAKGNTPATPPAPPVPPGSSSGDISVEFYSVLTASFKEEGRAVSEAKRLAGSGRPVFVYPITDGSNVTWYRIMTGRFSSNVAAKAYAEELRRTPGMGNVIGLKVHVSAPVWPQTLPPVQ